MIDPLLDVPDCLLPEGVPPKEQRYNLSLVSKAGDIRADAWVREWSAYRCQKTLWHATDVEGDEDDYWADGWTYRHPPEPSDQGFQLPTLIEARTGKGSVSLRIVRILAPF